MFHASLMAQTHLKDLYGLITYTWDEATQSLLGDLTQVTTEMENRFALDPISGETVAWEFIRSVKNFKTESMLGIDTLRSNRNMSWIIDSYLPSSQIDGTADNDSLVGTEAPDGIRGGNGDDTITGGAGDDVLYGGLGDDTLDGGDGADTLVGGAGNDLLGTGDSDYWGPGNIYEGGEGNDWHRGTYSGDLYRFNLGDGQDTIQEAGYSYMKNEDDILRFGAGINPADIDVERSGSDLVFKHINGTDRVTVLDWYGDSNYRLERIEFEDETVIGLSDLQLGTTTGDTLNGTSEDTVLVGYEGDDTLNGGAGNDLISGGLGNDSMIGEMGNDTYIFRRGDGQDTISDYDTTAGNSDKVNFNLNPIDLIFANNGNDLNIEIYNSTDQLTVQNQNLSSAY